MDLLLNTYKLLRRIQQKKTDSFSGLGLVIYDEKEFDPNCHCDLRPEIACPQLHITEDGLCHYLLEIAEYYHTLHDGFHMINNEGFLTHVAQYFVPPVVKNLKPNRDHGVRLYSSMCGSTLKGVAFIGIISSNNDIFFFKNGEYVDLNDLERRAKNEE